MLTIGNNVDAEIQGLAAGSQRGLTTAGQPFGGSLEPHVWFGDALIAGGITHYRWSYRRLGSSGAWTALDRQVVRHYAEIAADSTLTFKPFLLGPDPAYSGQNLFKIQPEDPPTGTWAPMVDARENTASGFFLSHLLKGGNAAAAAGKYELKLELFHADGSLVNLTDEGVLVKEPTIAAPFGPNTVPTATAAEAPDQGRERQGDRLPSGAAHGQQPLRGRDLRCERQRAGARPRLRLHPVRAGRERGLRLQGAPPARFRHLLIPNRARQLERRAGCRGQRIGG